MLGVILKPHSYVLISLYTSWSIFGISASHL